MAKLLNSWYTPEAIVRFTMIDGNELVEYSSIQNRNKKPKAGA